LRVITLQSKLEVHWRCSLLAAVYQALYPPATAVLQTPAVQALPYGSRQMAPKRDIDSQIHRRKAAHQDQYYSTIFGQHELYA